MAIDRTITYEQHYVQVGFYQNFIKNKEQEIKDLNKENDLLKHNIKEMQEQIYDLYKRIDQLVNGNMERKTSDRD